MGVPGSAWHVGRWSYPESPGFRRGLLSCVHEKHRIVAPLQADACAQPVSWQTQFAGAAVRILRSNLGRSRDRRKLEELCSRKTQHPAVFSWQTQFAGAAVRILRSSLGRSRDRRKLEEHWAYPRPRDETSAVPAARHQRIPGWHGTLGGGHTRSPPASAGGFYLERRVNSSSRKNKKTPARHAAARE